MQGKGYANFDGRTIAKGCAGGQIAYGQGKLNTSHAPASIVGGDGDILALPRPVAGGEAPRPTAIGAFDYCADRGCERHKITVGVTDRAAVAGPLPFPNRDACVDDG